MSTKIQASKYLISARWHVEAEVTDAGRVNILRHWRDDGAEMFSDGFEIEETDGRIAAYLLIGPRDVTGWLTEDEDKVETYCVDNPRHVFDYDDE